MRITIVLIIIVFTTTGFKTDTIVSCSMKPTHQNEVEFNLKVAGAKLAVSDDISTNVASIRKAIDYARREGADILLTPEGSLSG
ncbi:MAG: hypothetical protein KAT15_26650, partial [Bacteroidales bacterium]|nr:hypothetical protein [Bacteroidales bacterium]